MGCPTPSNDGSAVFVALTGTDWKLKYKALKRPDDDLEYRLMDGRRQAREKFDTASWSFGVVFVFCDFFGQAELYNPDIRTQCTSRGYKANLDTVNRMIAGGAVPEWKGKTDAIQAANWSEALDIWTERAKNLIQKIQ